MLVIVCMLEIVTLDILAVLRNLWTGDNFPSIIKNQNKADFSGELVIMSVNLFLIMKCCLQ